MGEASEGTPTPFQLKLEAFLEGRTIRSVARAGFEGDESTIGKWRTGESPSLALLQSFAAAAKVPVCYWADDAWPVGEPGRVPAHYSRGYGAGKTDHGLVGEGSGGDVAAEEAAEFGDEP